MTPDFDLMLASAVLFALAVLAFIRWRFGGPDALAFAILAGVFTACLDFVSSFVAQNYEYPGQSRAWVFTFILFGWIGMCGSCLFVAEGIVCRPGRDLITQRGAWWQVALLTGAIAVVLDLFIDPIAVRAGYWVWSVEGTVWHGIPLLNYVGWFVLMTLAPLGWALLARRRGWGWWRKGGIAALALVPLSVAAVAASLLLNGLVAMLGVR